MRIIIIFVILIIILSSFVSADINFNPDINSISQTIKHGNQYTFQTTLLNINKVCGINCKSQLLKNNQDVEDKSYTISAAYSTTYSYTFAVLDYTLEHTTYTLNFFCSDSTSCLFKSSKQQVKTYNIDIESALNDAELAAKSFIETNLKINII